MNGSKPNILSGHTTHFDSTGKYYSYGNKRSFEMKKNSSVGQYVHKKSSINVSIIEEMVAAELEVGVKDLSNVVPRIKSLLTPAMNTAFNHQTEHGNIDLNKISASQFGLWQISVAVNAQTNKFHTIF